MFSRSRLSRESVHTTGTRSAAWHAQQLCELAWNLRFQYEVVRASLPFVGEQAPTSLASCSAACLAAAAVAWPLWPEHDAAAGVMLRLHLPRQGLLLLLLPQVYRMQSCASTVRVAHSAQAPPVVLGCLLAECLSDGVAQLYARTTRQSGHAYQRSRNSKACRAAPAPLAGLPRLPGSSSSASAMMLAAWQHLS